MARRLSLSIGLAILATIVLASGRISPALAAKAQANQGIVISPFLTETRVLPTDATKDVSVIVTNATEKQQSFSVSALDFGSLNESGGIAFAGDNPNKLTTKYGLASWLDVPNDHVSIDAGGSTKVQATIRNEASLGPGGHYAAIVLTVDSPPSKNGGTVTVTQKISALIFATKVGGEVYDLKLASIQHDGNRQRLPTLVTLKFQNTGNVHVVPRGVVKLIAPGGSIVSQGIVNEASSYVLPETSRQMVVEMQNVGGANWRPGTYRLQVDYRYDGYNRFASKSVNLHYINVSAILWVLLGIALGAYGGIKLWQHRHAAS